MGMSVIIYRTVDRAMDSGIQRQVRGGMNVPTIVASYIGTVRMSIRPVRSSPPPPRPLPLDPSFPGTNERSRAILTFCLARVQMLALTPSAPMVPSGLLSAVTAGRRFPSLSPARLVVYILPSRLRAPFAPHCAHALSVASY